MSVASMAPIVSVIRAGLMGNQAIPMPRFILDRSTWEIRDVENEPGLAAKLDEFGYGIISYTWGRFQNKKTYENSPLAPSFAVINDPGLPNPMWWYIPKMQDGQFTMQQIRGVIERLGTTYVWW